MAGRDHSAPEDEGGLGRRAPLPMVLRSRAALSGEVVSAQALPLQTLGSTFTMAQEASWLDADHFAVGRWDGSLSIFNFNDSPTGGPRIAMAVNSPAEEGVQMITPVPGTSSFFSSNDDRSIALWYSGAPGWAKVSPVTTLGYDPAYGVANSGAVVQVDGRSWLVVGHANGCVTVWSAAGPVSWSFVTVADVRSAHPVNPWGLANVRAVGVLPAAAGFGFVLTGSEDGNLTVVRIPDGRIMSAAAYNPSATRGINSLAVCGDSVLVANCAVGPSDCNLWAFRVDPQSWGISNTAKANLVVDPAQPQVFNFDVVWAARDDGQMTFFCSTEEGALWMGEMTADGGLEIQGHEIITAKLGSALCRQDARLAVVGYDLRQFRMPS